MRQLFLYLSTQKGMRNWMETSPVAKKLTQRFVAGETLEDELAVCATLAKNKVFSTLDHLGENVTSLAEATASRDAYLLALDEIAKRDLPSTVSIKLTQFGLDLSPEACLENVLALTGHGIRVEVDMESALQGRL
jgi:proline dehydrogenase